MKFSLLVLFTCLFAFVASFITFKNPECGEPHSTNGANHTPVCRAYWPSWSYNANTKECVSFVYGGCNGNDNRFDSKETCEKTCLE
ncbi:male accessory gland serine protease inhibitor-like [Drosophila innubila]|uniref:male accessory gland serine protease inhibitor-like n=1 Tax=Drosophila innubila TaxID=198719 RepID=UPI00148C9982|nr:male accessory gland serine protease inhibitor-like [Drosophila innubila]